MTRKYDYLLLWIWIAAFALLVSGVEAFELGDERPTETQTKSKSSKSSKPKNIILFMTDDQDVTANSIDPDIMPHLHRLFRQGGMQFPNYYVSTGLCCPSRATLLKGQYCHNTEIWDNGDFNNQTYQSGAFQKFLDQGLEDETIATLLKSHGYETLLVGKYMNGYDLYHKHPQPGLHKPLGWDHWMGLLKCFNFYGPVFSDNGTILKCNKTVYQTDFIKNYVLDFLHSRTNDKPFFLMVTPFAPHAPATPAKRHEHLFPDARFPRFDSFNLPDHLQKQKPAWIGAMPPLTQDQIDDMDEFYGRRLRSLQAVDEALGEIAQTLEDLGLTEDTYFMYTADNGQHFGDFRIPAGKRQAYETDVKVPFLVRGPGIQPGSVSQQVVQSVDLGPTFLDIASSSSSLSNQDMDSNDMDLVQSKERRRGLLQSTYPMDGKSILPLLMTNRNTTSTNNTTNNTIQYNDFRWAALLEMYSGSSNMNPRYKNMTGYWWKNHLFPNTYQAVRVIDGPPLEKASNEETEINDVSNLLYVEWCNGEQELYNMTVDPHQVHNLLASPSPPPTILPLVQRLSRLVAKLGDCQGSDCYDLDWWNEEPTATATNQSSSFSWESLKASIQNRIPCHNPPNWNTTDASKATNVRRRPFAYDRFVPEPFQDGFPFSDGDIVPEDLLRVWEAYEHYFY